ncbi:hypothetical protein [Paramicrobacterium fandaimingii]|uniref:hypothetical protein n=1 Tax=Paramicrobacterium fandaimingii TaxID=2708079 RepID=UPI001420AC17|nr:hypothetical protein [Microbacterium fandaimingii]
MTMLDVGPSRENARYAHLAENRERGDITLDRLSDHEWRVTDRRLDEHDAPSVLGIIEQTDVGFTVLEINELVAQWTAESLDDAVSLFVTADQE